MTTFQTINMILPSREHTSEATTPTTPRAFQTAPSDAQQTHRVDASEPTTPTRLSFAGSDSQRPLPSSTYEAQVSFQTPLQPASQTRQSSLKREESQRSAHSNESMEVDLEESEEEEDGSDAESDNEQTGRPAKKKKGQRFFCTDFPPCNLSFTRSEHLARHIRKHTGERPFQCHCTRRFSRLDNLRQHAQTVHVNEEIPGDSLAATGTRFQRQIRTDRVRPPGPRSRASTVGSQGGGHSRGHSRNLSSSSVGSNASTISNNDVRRRPPSMMIPQDSSPRGKLSIDTRGHIVTPPRTFAYTNSPSGGPNTPSSSTYSNDLNSPFGSTAGSPIASGHRYSGSWNVHGQGRRLSVPSGANPFQPPHNQTYPPYFSPLTPATMSNNSSNSSLLASPVSSVYSFSSRHDPQAAEAESRRRTWHPSTYSNYPRPATSGLSYYQTPDAPRPSFAPQAVTAVNNSQRLPGIDAIDHFVNRPRTPQRSGPWPVENESPQKGPLSRVAEQVPANAPDRRSLNSWDLSLHQGITKLDLASGTPPKDLGLWGQQTIAEIQNAASSTGFGPLPPPPSQQHQPQYQTIHHSSGPLIHQESQKRPADVDHYPTAKPESNRSRRNGWYNGPPIQVHQQPMQVRPANPQRRSPEDSSSSDGIPTPSSTAGGMDPIILQNGGFVESQGPVGVYGGQQHFTFPPRPKPQLPTSNSAPAFSTPQDTAMSGLEALVAAATSEEKLGGSAMHAHSQ